MTRCIICDYNSHLGDSLIHTKRKRREAVLENGLCETCNTEVYGADSLDFPCEGSLDESYSFVLYTDDAFDLDEIDEKIDKERENEQ